MVELEIPYKNITVADFVGLTWFNQLYDNIYCDGDRQSVVIVNPTEDLKRILRVYRGEYERKGR